MKKRLLLMAAFVLACVSSSFAYNVGEYAYNATQRFKVLGENLVQNGNFAQARDGWYGIDKETAPNADVWDFIEGAGPNGENVLQSLGATANEPLCNDWQLQGGGYIVSFDMKYTAAGITSIITAGSDPGANCMDFFLNSDGSFTKVASTEEAPVTNVATAQNYVADEWKSVVFFFTAEQGQHLVMHFERLAEGFQITNFEIHEAAEVYDVRIIQNRLAFARQLMDDPNFNVDEAQEARANLEGIIATIEEMIAAGEMDDKDYAESTMVNFEDEGLSPYLDATTQNLKKNTYFNYVEDLTAFPKYNRGSISEGQVIGGFQFHGGNWLHGQGAAELAKQIQGTYDNGPGSVALYSTVMPAGKYMVSAEVRNAYCDKDYNLTFSLESEVKGFVGSDSVSFGMIKGEDYVRFYLVGEVKEGEDFQAGFWWAGPSTGSRFDVRSFEIRAFGDVEAYFNHRTAWNAFIAQWNAAVSNREKLMAMIGDKNYPWAQDSLSAALAQWDPYYNEIIAKGWVNAEGEDAGVATTDELNDWAQYQGVEMYSEPDEEGNVTRLTYQVVRGYQNAINYVVAANKPIGDLAAAIADAETTRDDDGNFAGDKASYQKVIDAAKAAYDDIFANTNDARREADEATIADLLEQLAAAKEAFLQSAKLEPIIDIDFANNFEEQEDGTYIIKGAKGEMNFGSNAIWNTDDAPDNNKQAKFWTKGYGEENMDVIRVGNTEATVTLAEDQIPGDEEVLRFNFDWWGGYLVNRKMIEVKLLNAADEVVAGFCRSRAAGNPEYNDFNNEAGEGLDLSKYSEIGSSSQSNMAIYADNNKSSFELKVDYKAKAVAGTIVNGKNGSSVGAFIPFKADIEDTKVVKFSISSSYDNADRRNWFDNMQVYKYPSQADGPIVNAISTVNAAAAAANQGIYTLSGQKVEKAVKGLYIINGKKVFVK